MSAPSNNIRSMLAAYYPKKRLAFTTVGIVTGVTDGIVTILGMAHVAYVKR